MLLTAFIDEPDIHIHRSFHLQISEVYDIDPAEYPSPTPELEDEALME